MKTNEKTKKGTMIATFTNAFLLTSLFLVGCSAEDTVAINEGAPSVELTTPLTVTSASLEAEMSTRAATTLTAGEIGVFLNGANYQAVDNKKYSKTGNNDWTPSDGPIFLGAQDAKVCAYHPYDATYNDESAIPLTSQSYLQSADLSYAKNITANASSSASTVSFSMQRAYSKLTVQLKRQGYPGSCFVSKTLLKNMKENSTLNITDGTYATGTDGEITSVKSATLSESNNYTSFTEFLLVPLTPTGGKMGIELTVDGKIMKTEVTYAPKAGILSTVKLTITGSGLKVGEVTIEDWPATPVDLGELTPTPA